MTYHKENRMQFAPRSTEDVPEPDLVPPDVYCEQAQKVIEAANAHLSRLHHEAKQVQVQIQDAERVLAMAQAAYSAYSDGDEPRLGTQSWSS